MALIQGNNERRNLVLLVVWLWFGYYGLRATKRKNKSG